MTGKARPRGKAREGVSGDPTKPPGRERRPADDVDALLLVIESQVARGDLDGAEATTDALAKLLRDRRDYGERMAAALNVVRLLARKAPAG